MNNLSHKKRNFNHFTLNERKFIQKLSRNGLSASSIARLLDRHRSSISRQLNNKSNTDFVKVGSKVKRLYVASMAQLNYETYKSNCGAKYKLLEDKKLITYIEDCDISAKSIYNYIDRNQLKITPFHLRFKLRRKKPKKHHIPP